MSPRAAVSSPIEQRKKQISKEIDKLHERITTRTRRNFKTEQGYARWRQGQLDKICSFEEELSVLNDPGEYDELPVAVVAEELGLSLDKVNSMLRSGELEPSDTCDEPTKDRISRAELERALDVGVEELLRKSAQESDEIFEESISHVHAGDIEKVEKARMRIEARDSYRGLRLPALGIALELMKGDLEGAQFSLRLWLDMDQENLATLFTYLGRLLRGIRLPEHGAQAVCEHILDVADGANPRPYDYLDHRSKQIGKHLDEEQRRAMYLATAVQNSLKKYRHVQQFKSYRDRSSHMRDEEFETIIRDAIYTALYAEATYQVSAASKIYVNSTIASIPRWFSPAGFLAHLPKLICANELAGNAPENKATVRDDS
jgi:hypothetical protein